MKKYLSILLLFAMLLPTVLLSSCSIKNTEPQQPDDEDEEFYGNLRINGNYAEDYSVVYPESFKNYAIKLAGFLSELNGKEVPVAEDGKQTSPHAVKFIKYEMEDDKVLDYNYKTVNGDILFYVAEKDADSAVDKFIETYTPKNSAEVYNVRVSEPYAEFLGDSDFNNFILKEETKETLAPGVAYYCYKYKDSSNYPVKAHVVVAKPGSVRVEVGIPNAVEDKIDGHEQKVSEQVKCAENKYSYDVVSATNGSFFYMNKDPKSSPTGVSIKNGKIVSDAKDGYYDTFAVMKDGSYYIGDRRELNLDDVWQMLSGHFISLKDGHIVYQVDDGEHFFEQSYERYPRTALGIKEDGTLVMVVIDGRQKTVSMGATMNDLGMVLLSLGCYRAINFDGGGSSTLYTTSVKNSPSDGKERKVGNSVLFIKNENYQE